MKYTTEPFEVIPIAVSIGVPEIVEIDDLWYVQADAYNEHGQVIGTLKRFLSEMMVPDFQNNAELPLMYLCDSRGIVITGTIEE